MILGWGHGWDLCPNCAAFWDNYLVAQELFQFSLWNWARIKQIQRNTWCNQLAMSLRTGKLRHTYGLQTQPGMFPGSWVSIFSFFQQPLSKDTESSLFFLQFLGFRSPGKATGHSGRCSRITAPSGMLSLVETLPMLYGFGVILFLCPPEKAGSSN